MEENYPTIKLELDEHSFLCVSYATAQNLKRVRQELAMIREGAKRELKSWEKCMLPSTLQQADQQTLNENIDPWITLESCMTGALEDMEAAYARYKQEEDVWHEKLVAERKRRRALEEGTPE